MNVDRRACEGLHITGEPRDSRGEPDFRIDDAIDDLLPKSDERLAHALELLVDFLESHIDLLEPLIDLLESTVNLLEPLVNLLEPLVDLLEPLVHFGEPVVHAGELVADTRAKIAKVVPDLFQEGDGDGLFLHDVLFYPRKRGFQRVGTGRNGAIARKPLTPAIRQANCLEDPCGIIFRCGRCGPCRRR